MRIGILGGTFDPIHQGHLALAHAAREQLRLDRVVFVPAFVHPLKQKSEIVASAQARLEMVKLAVKGEPVFEVSDCEIKRRGTSYTVDTLREMKKKHPEPNELFFITGGDWGKGLDQWKEIDTIFSLARFVVASRPGFDFKRLPKQVQRLSFVPLGISSTRLREKIKSGEPVLDELPKSVFQYITDQGLYQSEVIR